MRVWNRYTYLYFIMQHELFAQTEPEKISNHNFSYHSSRTKKRKQKKTESFANFAFYDIKFRLNAVYNVQKCNVWWKVCFLRYLLLPHCTPKIYFGKILCVFFFQTYFLAIDSKSCDNIDDMQLIWSKALARYSHLDYVPLRLFISLNWNIIQIWEMYYGNGKRNKLDMRLSTRKKVHLVRSLWFHKIPSY